MVHLCEQKRRHAERDETGVRMGMQAYLRFYEITQGSARLKTWDDFVKSPYYKAFVRFGRHCQNIRAVNPSRFTDWLIRGNRKIDHWCRDAVYTEWLNEYVRLESVADALARGIETAIEFSERSSASAHDFLRYGNDNAICFAITNGRITAWVLYNCESGQGFLSRINQEQLTMIWPWIDSDFWDQRFRDHMADQEYARAMLAQAGW